MGHVMSPVEALDRLRFSEIKKGKIAQAKRVLRLSDQTFLIELSNGSMTVAGQRHIPNGNWAVLGYGTDELSKSVLDGLISFGVLTREQVDAHKAAVERADEKQRVASARERLRRACADLGIPVPEMAS